MFFLIILLLLLSLILEGSVTVLPLVMMSLLLFVIFGYEKQALFAAFIAGLFLDTFLLRTSGLSGVFFVMFVFIMTLYQRKFEIDTYQFVLFASLLGSITYLYLFQIHNALLFSIISAVVAMLLYGILKRISPMLRKHKSLHYTL